MHRRSIGGQNNEENLKPNNNQGLIYNKGAKKLASQNSFGNGTNAIKNERGLDLKKVYKT